MLVYLAPILVLGIVVFVHELGHFLAAKAFGVYAPRFSLGWGKPIVKWRRQGSETEYVISRLPIGGYVRMASRNDETSSMLEGGNETLAEGAELGPNWDPEAMVPHGPKPVPADRWFESKPTYARVVILLAGVTMNAVLTLCVATGVFAVYGRSGDLPTVIDTLVAGKPADNAGIQRGDSVIAVDGVPVQSWTQFVAKVSADTAGAARVEVVRGARRLTFSISPEVVSVADPATGVLHSVAKIGVGPLNPDTIGNRALRAPMSLGESISAGWRATWVMAGSVVSVVGGLFRGSVSVKTLGGPYAIAHVSVAAAKSGIESLLGLLAFLSINLAVLNLLPVPVLDGGQILITLAEGAKGGQLNARTRDRLMWAGIAVVGLLFVTVMVNDAPLIFNDIKSVVKSIFGST